MNERIRELAIQAGDDWNQTLPSDREFLHKFAELIVQECVEESMAEIMSDEDIAQEDDPLVREFLKGNNQGIVDAVVRFRNHFGDEK
jgi:hypothetical protein